MENTELIQRQRLYSDTRKPYSVRVAELIDLQGYAYPCEYGHTDCSMVEGGHCADEMELIGGRS